MVEQQQTWAAPAGRSLAKETAYRILSHPQLQPYEGPWGVWSCRPWVLSTWVTAAEQTCLWEASRDSNWDGLRKEKEEMGDSSERAQGHRSFQSGTSGKVNP